MTPIIEITKDKHVNANVPSRPQYRAETPIFWETVDEWNAKADPQPKLVEGSIRKPKARAEGRTAENTVVVVGRPVKDQPQA